MFRIALCDDNIEFLKLMKAMIIRVSEQIRQDLKIDIKCYSKGQHLIDDFSENKRYDLVMLDWDMPDMNGEETGRAIRVLDQDCLIIFITAFDNFAIQASKLTMFRYITKSKLREELPEALLSSYNKQLFNEKLIQIKEISKSSHIVRVKDIIYLESRSAKTTVHLKNKYKLVTTRSFLNNHSEYFIENGFLKPFRGILINWRELASIESQQAVMTDGSLIPVSRKYKKNIFMMIQKLMENDI